MENQMNEIIFLIPLAWAEGGIDVGDPMLKIEKCSEDRSAHASEIRKLIWLSMIKESYGTFIFFN